MAAPSKPSQWAYLGCRTTRERGAMGVGITQLRFQAQTGRLEPVAVLPDLTNPSYLAYSATHAAVFAVHGDQQEASAFRVDTQSGAISLINTVSTEGRNPVHLVLAPDGAHLIVTNHQGASVVALPIAADGRLLPVVSRYAFTGPAHAHIPLGPHRTEQAQAKPHFAGFDASGRYLWVPDKGLDRVFTLRYANPGLLESTAPAVAREGAGPRHLACHPSQPWVYGVNELDNSLSAYALDANSGSLKAFQVLPSLPEHFTGPRSRAAAIAVDASGRTLYCSNRGHESIGVYAIEPQTGRLRAKQWISSGGKTPRFITLSPCGRWLFALNEDSHCVVNFAVDATNGELAATGWQLETGSPVCLVFGGPSN